MANSELGPHGGGVESRAEEFEPRPFENTIVALDIDGVLVEPRAYRQAVRLTIAFFAQKLDVNPEAFMLDDKNKEFGRSMSHFEAEGIHDPWDVSAIVVSIMELQKAGVNVSPRDALQFYKDNPDKKAHPPDVILEQLRLRYQRVVPTEVMGDITRTLSNTRDPFRNEITSVFQEFVLGEETFISTYGKPSQTGAEESLLKTMDRSLINDGGRREITKILLKGGMVVIYTARPGLPPYDAQREPADGYAPEAELAVEKSRIKSIGIVSMGSMEWLSRLTGAPVEDLTKPNPTQALATILSALRGMTDVKVLMDAYEWGQTGEAPQDMQPFIGEDKTKLELVVVEDSPSGVRAFINAKSILENKGVRVGLTAIGVHGVSYEKHMAFVHLGKEEGMKIDTNSGIGEGIIRYSFGVQGRREIGSLEQ